MFPVLDDSIIDIGGRHLPAIYAMQDLGSVMGLVAVLIMVGYSLRRGHQPAVPNRLMPSRERLVWTLIYLLAGLIFTATFYVWAKIGQPPTHSIVVRASVIAIASLRGLTAALVSVSFVLDFRLRALHHRSPSGPER